MLQKGVRTLTSAGGLQVIALAGLIGWGVALLIHLPSIRSLTDARGKSSKAPCTRA